MKSLVSHIAELVDSPKALFSDIQIENGHEVVWKTPTGWEQTGFGLVSQEDMLPLMNAISKEWKSGLAKGEAINKTIMMHGLRLRCSLYTTCARERVAITARLLPVKPPRIEELGLPIQVGKYAHLSDGLVIIAGATGAGKTTTISSIIDRINHHRSCHIVTIEDPVEILHENKKSIITHREVGKHGDVASFEQGVLESLRQCPDVIVVGEVRDSATAEATLLAAESGHLVIATVHARDAVGAMQKLMSFFGDESRQAKASSIAATIRGALFQVRVPNLDGTRSIVVPELIDIDVGNSQDIYAALLSHEKSAQLRDRMRSGSLIGSVSMNSSVKALHANKLISDETVKALQANYRLSL